MKARIRKKLASKPYVELWEGWAPGTDGDEEWDEHFERSVATRLLTIHRCRACGIIFVSQKRRGELCRECRYRGYWRALEILARLPKDRPWRGQWEQAEYELGCRFCEWEDRRKRPNSATELQRLIFEWTKRLEQHERRHILKSLKNSVYAASSDASAPGLITDSAPARRHHPGA